MADVLAVIPCLNEEQHLEKLVVSLAAMPMRIVIVDGGSTDRTLTIAEALAAKYPNVHVLNNPKRIQSSAINLAVYTYGAGMEFLIRIDAHADYPENYCQVLIEEAQRTKSDSVVVAMKTVGRMGFQKAVAAAQNSKLGNGGSAHRLGGGEGRWVDHGHHALMRIEAFRKIGGYDESFSHNEDAELDLRLTQAGYKIWLTGKTWLTYYPRSTPFALMQQYVRYGAGRAATIRKHFTLPKLRQLAPAAVVPALLFSFAVPFFPWAPLPFAIWAVVCLGYGGMLAARANDSDLVMAGPAAMIMHLGWSLGFWGRMLERNKG